MKSCDSVKFLLNEYESPRWEVSTREGPGS